jgi:serine/threonine protein kinase
MNEGGGQDPRIGQTFRGYRIDHLIARGGMGAVYRARDEALPNVCKVIKVLLPELAVDASTRAFVLDRFEREALAVSVLKHDNIVGIHSIGTLDDGQPCMLMDYVEGQPLDDVIRSYKGRVPPYRVMHYMCHVARGLDFAHALGIVHRDLKPSNIMACPTDNDPYFCKLLDFGVAKFTRPIAAGQLVPTMGGMGLGTPCFMAVEQFRHADEATAVSDVYSLAIIIWLMVTGELPWGQHDTSSPLGLSVLYESQRDKAPNPPPPGTLPPAWARTLRAALSPDADARPPSVRHFMVELAIGLEPEGSHVKGGIEILRSHAESRKKLAAPEARRHLAQGNKLYNIRSFDQAIEEYKAGALVEEAPVFDYNLGQAFRQLGKYEEAIWHYERFLNRGDPQGEVLDAVNGFLAQMKSELAKQAMTQKPIKPGGASNPSQELQASQNTPQDTHPPQVNSVAETARSPWTMTRGIALGLASTGLVSLAAGVVFGLQTQGLKNDVAQLCPMNPCVDANKVNMLTDRAGTRATLANVSYGVGAGMIAGAAILWYIGAPSAASSRSRSDYAILPHFSTTFTSVIFHRNF